MKKAKKTWVLSTPKKVKTTPPELEKQLVEAKFKPIIEELKNEYIEKPHPEYNYRVDIYSKWYRNYFYLCSKYKSESPKAISKEFELKFTRLEYKGKNSFDIAYMRHT